MQIYYEDYRLQVVEKENGKYDIRDSKFGGRAIHNNKTKEQTDEIIQRVLSKRNNGRRNRQLKKQP